MKILAFKLMKVTCRNIFKNAYLYLKINIYIYYIYTKIINQEQDMLE